MGKNAADKKKTSVKLWVYVTSLIVVSAVSIGGTVLLTNAQGSSGSSDESVVSETGDSELSTDLSTVQALYDRLMSGYFQEVDGDVLIEGALSGMADAIEDPYTEYLDNDQASNLEESISASFEGIGAEVIKQGDNVMVVAPIAGSPAEEAGLQPNDIILQAGDQELTGMSLTEAVSYIRGEKGTEVILTIQRGQNTFEVPIVRDTIPVETVLYSLDETDPTIGYIAITTFSTPTYDELVSAIEELRNQGAESFVFDVRQNPGGLLNAAINISNIFLEDGEIIMQTQEKDADPVAIAADAEAYGDFRVSEPSVLLINEGSASASEILAGALRESADIPLIGSNSFGKGTVQTIAPLEGNSEIKYTVAKWLTPDGNWIHETGIEPDIAVEMPEFTNLLIIDSSQSYEAEDVSDEVENIELILDALNYEGGPSDGYFDSETVEAVEAFQEDNNLAVTGVVTGETANLLMSKLRDLIENTDPQYDEAIQYLQEN